MLMKRIRNLVILFCLLTLGIFTYSYIKGKSIDTISEIDLHQIKEVAVFQRSAGFEGRVSNVNDMNSMYDENANNFDYLFQKSDLVAEAKINDRKQHMRTILSNIEILNVYKGDKEKKGKNINVYEPMGYERLDLFRIFGANLPMREDQTYIVFLKQEKTGIYNYVSSLYGKYNTKEDAYVNVKNDELSVKDMMKNDMILFVYDEEKRQEITSQMKDDGYNEQEIKSKLEGYQRLAKLKDTREIIRASFDQLISQK